MRYYVYILLDPRASGKFDNPYSEISMKPFYVGKGDSQCKSKSVRHIMHYTMAEKNCPTSHKSNPQKHNTIRKLISLGYEPMFEVIFRSDDEQQCFEVEKELITLYGKSNSGGLLTNIADGGAGGNTIDTIDGLKDKLRVINSAKWSGENNPNFQKPLHENFSHKSKLEGNHWNDGRLASQETRDKMKESRKKKPLLHVVRVDMKTLEELEVLTRQEAQQKHGGGITRSLKHGGACNGFFWKYLGSELKLSKTRETTYELPKVVRLKRRRIMYKKSWNSPHEIAFDTLQEASDHTGINRVVISRKCQCNNTKFHIFRHEDKEFKFDIKIGHRKRVKMIKEGIVTKFDSITHAANTIGASVSAVFAAVSGRNKTCRGATFEYYHQQTQNDAKNQ